MDLFEWLKVLLLGVVEGITEWLPISSTGHMILIEELVHLNVSEDFTEMFRVVIQGNLVSVVQGAGRRSPGCHDRHPL